MKQQPNHNRLRHSGGRHSILNLAALSALAASTLMPAAAQTTTPVGPPHGIVFSIDVQSASIRALDAFSSAPIGGADILTIGDGGAPGPNYPVWSPTERPGIVDHWRDLGLTRYLVGTGFPGGAPRQLEIDALSQGFDNGDFLAFSLLEQARAKSPTVRAEARAGEASGDVFVLNLATGGISLYVDGDGTSQRGLGVVEPNPAAFALPDEGDNVDALDILSIAREDGDPIYFSLDGFFNDPTEPRRNSGSAFRNGFSPADVLVQEHGGGTSVFIPASSLGLTAGTWDTVHDDLDALVLFENGNGDFDPYRPVGGWDPDDTRDVILFSVRAGSAVIGDTCPVTGLRIEEGDVLTVPPSGSFGPPQIVVRAETLGLVTHRTDGVTKAGISEVDALDLCPEDWLGWINEDWSAQDD